MKFIHIAYLWTCVILRRVVLFFKLGTEELFNVMMRSLQDMRKMNAKRADHFCISASPSVRLCKLENG
jgi:hypothetical protein